jgi:hypothetical protein
MIHARLRQAATAAIAGQYEIIESTLRAALNRAMLFLKAIIQAEWEANAPLREAMAIKRERLQAPRAKRAAERRSTYVQSSGD